MFKKENRLIPGIRFGKSDLFATPQFLMKKKKNGLAIDRFGIVVTKKIDKRATVRNRIKRFFRESIMNLNKKMNTGHDILFVIKKNVLGKTDEENLLAIKNTLGKAGLIKA